MPGETSNSSARRTLTVFQREVLDRLSAALPGFFLTGGSALGEQVVVDLVLDPGP